MAAPAWGCDASALSLRRRGGGGFVLLSGRDIDVLQCGCAGTWGVSEMHRHPLLERAGVHGLVLLGELRLVVPMKRAHGLGLQVGDDKLMGRVVHRLDDAALLGRLGGVPGEQRRRTEGEGAQSDEGGFCGG